MGRTRDTLPVTSWTQFGQLLRELRSDVSLRSVARSTALGHSTLSRYERAESTPSAEATDALDRYFGTGDRLTQMRNRLLLGESTRPSAKPRCRYAASFPAEYVGPVWIGIDRNGDQPFPSVHIRWGPWQRVVVELEANSPGYDRVVLCLAKGNDGLSIPIFVSTATPVIVAFGLGDVDGQGLDVGVIDANSLWTRAPD